MVLLQKANVRKLSTFLFLIGLLAIPGNLVPAEQQANPPARQIAHQDPPLCDTVTTFPEIQAFALPELGPRSGSAAGADNLGGDWSEPLVNVWDGTGAEVETRFKVGYDKQGLYFLVRCDEPSMATIKADAVEDGDNVISDDNIRVCIDPFGDGQRCYHFVMNTTGKRLQCREDSGTGWQGDWKGEVTRGTEAWTARLFIPWAAFELDERVGDSWRINVFRARQAAGESFLGWSPTFASAYSPLRAGYLKGLTIDFTPFMQCGQLEVADFEMGLRDGRRVFTYIIDYHSSDGETVDFVIDQSQLKVLSADLVVGDRDSVKNIQRIRLELSAPTEKLEQYQGFGMETAILRAQSRSGRSTRLSLVRTLPFTDIGPLPPLEHPYVFLTAPGVAELRERAAKDEHMKQAMERVFDLADDFVNNPVELPVKGGIFTDHYICQKHGSGLQWDRNKPHEHICPVGGEIYTGEVYDGVWRTKFHWDILGRLKYVSIAYLVSQDVKYAQAIRDTLLAYADRYESYPLYGQGGLTGGGLAPTTGARIGCETHHDAIIMADFVMVYDFTMPSGLYTEKDRGALEKRLFPAMIKVVQRYNAGKNNWQVTHNYGTTIAALLLRDRRLLDQSINGPTGFNFHMAQSVMPGGFFYEETLGYHNGVAPEFVWESVALANSGIDMRTCARLKEMVDFVVAVSDSYGLLPTLGDAHPTDVSSCWNLFLAAERLWGGYSALAEPPASAILAQEPPLDWLLYGYNNNNSPAAPRRFSADLAGCKIAVLGGPQSQVFAHFGNAGGHAHNDTMAITFNYGGQRVLIDPGTIGYANDAYRGYYKRTLAHNTLVVDEKDSSAGGAERTLFVGEGPVQVLEMQADRLFPKVRQKRLSLLIEDGFLVDFFQAASDQEHCYDYVLHFEKGQLAPCDPLALADSDRAATGAYQFLTQIKYGSNPNEVLWRYEPDKSQSTILAVTSFPRGVTFVAEAPGVEGSLVPPTRIIFQRVNAPQGRFVSVTIPGMSPEKPAPQVRFLDSPTPNDIKTAGVEMNWNGKKYLVANPDDGRFQGNQFTCQASAVCIRLDSADKPEMIFLVRGKELTLGDRTWQFSAPACVEIVNPDSDQPDIIIRQSDKPVEIITK